jgi:hypothetical protein
MIRLRLFTCERSDDGGESFGVADDEMADE